MFVLIAVLFTILATLLGYIYSKFARTLELSKNFVGPPSLPIIGQGHLFIGKKPEEYVKLFFEIIVKYPGCARIWLGPEFNLFISDLDLIETVLSNSKFNDKADQYKVLNPWLREGLLISKGTKWFKRRKIITPAFHFKILEQFIDVFEKEGNIMIENLSKFKPTDEVDLYHWVTLCALDVICGAKWFKRRRIITPAFHFNILEQFIDIFDNQSNILIKKLCNNCSGEIDLNALISLCALDVICESAMGVTANAQKDSDSEYVNAVRTISTVLHKRMFDIMYRYDFLFNLTPLARQQKKALKILHDFSERVILSRREELLKLKKDNFLPNENDFGQKKRMAFLDILLQSEIDGKPLSNLDIREEVDTFMFEGHDTTTSAITFCLYNLSKNPEIQEKTFQEVLSVFGSDKTKQATYDDLCNLRYLELVAKETLRLYPSVPILGRKVNEECTINGRIIPAGTNIGISPLALGRCEAIFPEAEKFIPERFDVVTSADKLNPFAFVPFSAGPRNCIGQKFAMFEIKSVVSKILRHFKLEHVTQDEPVLIAELILKTKDNIKFRLSPRVY